MPPLPKDPRLLQRRNRVSTRATLPTEAESAENEVPELYARPETENWHTRVVEWWHDAWTSPMAAEWVKVDVTGLMYRLAELQQLFWTESDPEIRVKIETKIMAAEEHLGLNPIARRRLQWEVEKGEQANDRTARRRQAKAAAAVKDPREVLKAV